MAVGYQLVLWNPYKKLYDLILAGGIGLYLAAFFAVSMVTVPAGETISAPILVIRALGTCAFLMLTIILSIGPLARLNTVFLPLLYNRRHFGVATFIVAFFHVLIATGWYHGFGVISPLASIFASSSDYSTVASTPFEVFGVAAFLVLFVMAATSHDFWLANLSPAVWKALHMLVYPAYAALCVHIALGVLQDEPSGIYWALLAAGILTVGGLHIAAGIRQWSADGHQILEGQGWHRVGPAADIPDNRARIVPVLGGESIAIFRYGDHISAVSNVCAHQNGPLGEGRIVDGCITCPWHGYQYRPEDGRSPPPYTEKIATYRVRIEGSDVYVHPVALAAGTRVQPAVIAASSMPDNADQ